MKRIVIDIYFKTAIIYKKERNWKDAITYFQKVLEIDSDCEVAKLWLNQCKINLNKKPK